MRIARATLLAAGLLAGSLPPAMAAEGAKIYLALWRGCEAACEGFKEGIRASGVEAEFIERNAAGDKAVLPDFVQEARALDVDLILAWGTTVTLGLVGPIGEAAQHAAHGLPEVNVVDGGEPAEQLTLGRERAHPVALEHVLRARSQPLVATLGGPVEQHDQVVGDRGEIHGAEPTAPLSGRSGGVRRVHGPAPRVC